MHAIGDAGRAHRRARAERTTCPRPVNGSAHRGARLPRRSPARGIRAPDRQLDGRSRRDGGSSCRPHPRGQRRTPVLLLQWQAARDRRRAADAVAGRAERRPGSPLPPARGRAHAGQSRPIDPRAGQRSRGSRRCRHHDHRGPFRAGRFLRAVRNRHRRNCRLPPGLR